MGADHGNGSANIDAVKRCGATSKQRTLAERRCNNSQISFKRKAKARFFADENFPPEQAINLLRAKGAVKS